MLGQILSILLLTTTAWSKAGVFDAKGTGCHVLMYAEDFNLTIGEEKDSINLLGQAKNVSSCSTMSNNGRSLNITFGDVRGNLTDLKVSFTFSSTSTGYWSTSMMTVSYNDGKNTYSLNGRFTSADMIGTSFSFACSLVSKTKLTATSPAGKAEVSLNKFQLQAYKVTDSKFSDSYQCVNWISKGAWMGIFTGIVLIVVLVLSVMMLLNTATPDRFETSKSKCLIIPHEH